MLNKLKLWAARVVLRNAGAPVFEKPDIIGGQVEILISRGKFWINAPNCVTRGWDLKEILVEFDGDQVLTWSPERGAMYVSLKNGAYIRRFGPEEPAAR